MKNVSTINQEVQEHQLWKDKHCISMRDKTMYKFSIFSTLQIIITYKNTYAFMGTVKEQVGIYFWAKLECKYDKLSNVAMPIEYMDKISPGRNITRTKCNSDKMSPK